MDRTPYRLIAPALELDTQGLNSASYKDFIWLLKLSEPVSSFVNKVDNRVRILNAGQVLGIMHVKY